MSRPLHPFPSFPSSSLSPSTIFYPPPTCPCCCYCCNCCYCCYCCNCCRCFPPSFLFPANPSLPPSIPLRLLLPHHPTPLTLPPLQQRRRRAKQPLLHHPPHHQLCASLIRIPNKLPPSPLPSPPPSLPHLPPFPPPPPQENRQNSPLSAQSAAQTSHPSSPRLSSPQASLAIRLTLPDGMVQRFPSALPTPTLTWRTMGGP